MSRVEVRVPTFRRPELLQRALKALVVQTHVDWRAFVIDDSAGKEGEKVVERLGDKRISYMFNEKNLGRVANLNLAFADTPFDASSEFACVLEDDNYWEPELLEANLAALSKSNLPILTRGYRVEDMDREGNVIANPDLPVHALWGDVARPIKYSERVAKCFFSFTLGNFGYFWRLHSGLDISCRQEAHNVHVAERLRSISFREDCWYEPAILSTFTRFISKSQTPSGESVLNSMDARKGRFSELKLLRHLYLEWTKGLGNNIRDIEADAQEKFGSLLVNELIDAGDLRYIIKNLSATVGVRVAKNIILWAIFVRSRRVL